MPEPRRGLTRWQWLLIILAVIAVIWYWVANRQPAGPSYGTVELATLGAARTGSGLIVREEIPYDADGVTSIEYLAEEGSSVLRNADICAVFSSGFSTREMTALQSFRDAIRDYQIKQIKAETTYDASLVRLESDVLSRAGEVRDIISGARGSLTNQEKLLNAAITARQRYLKKKYADDQRMTRLYDDETAQLQRIDSWTKKFTAAREGIVSFYTDGFEYGLNTSNWDTFTPAQVRRMIAGVLPEGTAVSKGRTTIYRMVTSDTWHLLVLADSTGWSPLEGEVYPIALDGNTDAPIFATVENVSRSGGELLIRLTVTGDLDRVLYLRACNVLLSDYRDRYRVPAAAVYRQNDMDGVVISMGGRDVFVPVNVLLRQGSDAYVWPVTESLLHEGDVVRLF